MSDSELPIVHPVGSFADRSVKSLEAFKRDVFPIIRPWLAGRMFSVEDQSGTNELACALDKCGIDAIVIQERPTFDLYGVAARTMNAFYSAGPPSIFMGFSIRCGRVDKRDASKISTDVEYYRIKRALLDEPESKLFAPLYSVQAGYVNKETDEPYYVAMIEMATLIKFIETNIEDESTIRRRSYLGSKWYDVPSAVLPRGTVTSWKNFPDNWSPYSQRSVVCGMVQKS